MSTTLLLPKYEEPTILDQLDAQCVVLPEEVQQWNSLVCEHHYLKNANLVGEQLRYVVSFQGQWLSFLGWSAASYHLKDPEAWVGWPDLQRRPPLPFFPQYSPFTIL